MAQVKDNVITEGLSGKLGKSNYCFRQMFGKTILGLKAVSSVPSSDNQVIVKVKFAEAARMARVDMKDPVKAKEWSDKLNNSTYNTAYGLAMATYFKVLYANK